MSESDIYKVQDSDALLIVDVQQDFLPGGHLPVKGGDEILEGINRVATKFRHVVLTADAHPAGHVSFASTHPPRQPLKDSTTGAYGRQPLWPDHCLQGTKGAEISPKLKIPNAAIVLHLGFRQDTDNISAFFEEDGETPTGLGGFLRERGIRRTFCCGLALDVCVGYTAVDSSRLGFTSFILEDLTRSTGEPDLLSQVSQRFAERSVRMCSSTVLEPTGTSAAVAGLPG